MFPSTPVPQQTSNTQQKLTFLAYSPTFQFLFCFYAFCVLLIQLFYVFHEHFKKSFNAF